MKYKITSKNYTNNFITKIIINSKQGPIKIEPNCNYMDLKEKLFQTLFMKKQTFMLLLIALIKKNFMQVKYVQHWIDNIQEIYMIFL